MWAKGIARDRPCPNLIAAHVLRAPGAQSVGSIPVALSWDAVVVLRFEIKGWRAKNKESRLPANRELAAAGIMEPVPGILVRDERVSGISRPSGGYPSGMPASLSIGSRVGFASIRDRNTDVFHMANEQQYTQSEARIRFS
jgi:hypothetical protein